MRYLSKAKTYPNRSSMSKNFYNHMHMHVYLSECGGVWVKVGVSGCVGVYMHVCMCGCVSVCVIVNYV